jgi:hypothetical protein
MFIYKLEINNYVYYGSTVKTLKEVYNMLKGHSTSKKIRDNKLYSAINMYGIENVDLSVYKDVGEVDRKDLDIILWGIVYKQRNNKNLLNNKYLKSEPKRLLDLKTN